MFNDHMSNYIDIETKNIKIDKENIIKVLDSLINNPKIQNLPRKNLTRM
jgi:hypothetical protein